MDSGKFACMGGEGGACQGPEGSLDLTQVEARLHAASAPALLHKAAGEGGGKIPCKLTSLTPDVAFLFFATWAPGCLDGFPGTGLSSWVVF